jgi:hypothetical protein
MNVRAVDAISKFLLAHGLVVEPIWNNSSIMNRAVENLLAELEKSDILFPLNRQFPVCPRHTERLAATCDHAAHMNSHSSDANFGIFFA